MFLLKTKRRFWNLPFWKKQNDSALFQWRDSSFRLLLLLILCPFPSFPFFPLFPSSFWFSESVTSLSRNFGFEFKTAKPHVVGCLSMLLCG